MDKAAQESTFLSKPMSFKKNTKLTKDKLINILYIIRIGNRR